MKEWLWNPKTKNSGIITCIPQKGKCPHNCEDCFFQNGRSYLEPLKENLTHIQSIEMTKGRIVRINDGNDSDNQIDLVIKTAQEFDDYFYNTSFIDNLDKFDAPFVLTINPAGMTNSNFYKLEKIPENLMFIRVRTNTWNIDDVVDPVVERYTSKEIPVILTFMAYFDEVIPEGHKGNYIYRKRTLNSYSAITTGAWEKIMDNYKYNPYVYSCGKIEGEKGTTKCSRCGNCIREYYNIKEKNRRTN